MIPGSVRL